MGDLASYRERIDAIDRQLVALFEERMDVVLEVARYKLQNGMEIFQGAREVQVLERAQSLLKNHAYDAGARELFTALMGISKDYQRQLLAAEETEPKNDQPPMAGVRGTIAYQGVPGSFSEQALRELFGEEVPTRRTDTFEDLCRLVQLGEVQCGVLPVENTTTGSVFEAYDLLEKYNLSVVGERIIGVQQHLLALPGARIEDIREVYSHSQGIAQCAGFLHSHPGWKLIPYYNTATSAKYVAEGGDKTRAAIASRRAAELYGLDILAEAINDVRDNNTRFLVIAREPLLAPGNKATAVFTLKNRPGTLAELLSAFAARGINMTKIESRPMAHRPFEYRFYGDFSGDLGESFRRAVEAARAHAEEWRLLGIYAAHAHIGQRSAE
jgi:chorismate mutase/prephenate dehydratase